MRGGHDALTTAVGVLYYCQGNRSKYFNSTASTQLLKETELKDQSAGARLCNPDDFHTKNVNYIHNNLGMAVETPSEIQPLS